MKHIIVLPNPEDRRFEKNRNRDWRTYQYSKNLKILHGEDIHVENDNDSLADLIPLRQVPAGDVGRYANFFTLDNELFMIHVGDTIQQYDDGAIEYYAKGGVRAIFILQRRTCFEYIFDNSPIPIFFLNASSDYLTNNPHFEQTLHLKSMNSIKKNSVFFSGKPRVRTGRKELGNHIKSCISDSVIRYGGFTPDEYLDEMCQSKIVWCPTTTAPCRATSYCNLQTGRDFEALCCELLVIKPKPGVPENEPRIDKVHYVEAKDDEIVDKIQYYLDHDDERKEIAHNGRLWFMRNSSELARAKHLFESSLSVIK